MVANRALAITAVCGTALFACAPVRAGDEKPPGPKKHVFRFENAKWDEVFDWYAKASDLTLITAVMPTGKFTFEPPSGKEYTLDEIRDIIDDALEPQGMLLFHRQVTFFIYEENELEDRIRRPFEVAALPQLPKRFFTGVEIRLENVKAADIRDEVKKLLGPVGSVQVFAKHNTLVVYDRVSNLRVIAEWVRKAELRATETISVRRKRVRPNPRCT